VDFDGEKFIQEKDVMAFLIPFFIDSFSTGLAYCSLERFLRVPTVESQPIETPTCSWRSLRLESWRSNAIGNRQQDAYPALRGYLNHHQYLIVHDTLQQPKVLLHSIGAPIYAIDHGDGI
jgi:hypothetical protein